MRRFRTIGLIVLIIAAAQLIRPDRHNPPVHPENSFQARMHPDAQVARVIDHSCSDCHSNRTVWPWYSKVAPMSWVVGDDVREGRAHLNFSEWGNYSPKKSADLLRDICDMVRQGDMPLWSYTVTHKGTKLTPGERAAVCGWTKLALDSTKPVAQSAKPPR
jgi:hypothetical protein